MMIIKELLTLVKNRSDTLEEERSEWDTKFHTRSRDRLLKCMDAV